MKESIGFSTHSLERGLERIMELEPPYSRKQKKMMAEFLKKNMTWHPIREIWVIEDYDAELVVDDDTVITLIIRKKSKTKYQKISVFQQTMGKKALRLDKKRNGKNKYK